MNRCGFFPSFGDSQQNRNSRPTKQIAGFVLLVLLMGLTMQAQTFRGSINGSVTDPSGSLVPNAQVVATEASTGVEHKTVTTTVGQFSFQDLSLGAYKITVSAPGFLPYTVGNVVVSAGTIYTLPIKLTVEKTSTTIEVSGAALTLDTTTQTQNYTIPTEAVENVPMNGRDFTQYVAISPGYGGYAVGGFGSLNGTRANQMNWQIDGVDNNDFWHNIPAVNQGGVSGIAGVVLPLDAIDQFSSQTQSGAEAGRNAGGTVNTVLKSGGNKIGGSVYFFERNEAYGAASPFFTPSADVPKSPKLRNLNYGFLVDGPIIRDKTFYLVSFEKQQYIIGLSGKATEPSDPWLARAQAVLTAHGVAPSSLSQSLIGVNGFWPHSQIASLPATISNFFSPIASTGYSYNGIIKLDHNFTSNHHLSVRWFAGQGSQTAPLGGSPALGTASSNLSYYFEKAPLHVQNYSAVLNSVLSTHLTNQVLFGVNYFNQTFNDANSNFDTKSMGLFLSPDALVNGKPILGAPNVAISGFEQIGLTPPEGRNDVTGHLSDIVSYTFGKHQLRFGGEVRQGRVNEFYHRRGTGKFTFDGTQGTWAHDTVDPDLPTNSRILALADYLAGDVSTSTIAVGDPERFVTVNGYNFYFQDSWQATQKLNLNFGLRYEYFGPLHSSKKDLGVFVPGKGLVVQGVSADNIFPPDRNNFAPRFGFAYQAKDDLVVRGGIGTYYDQINMNPFLDFRPPIAAAQGLQGNPIGAKPVSTYSRNAYNWQAVQAGGASIFPGVVACADPLCTATPGFNVYSVNQNFRAPYFFNYNLQIEKSLGKMSIFQIGYVGSLGRKLNIVTNINQYNDFPNFGSIIQLNSIGTSNYNALQATFRTREWHGVSSQFGYTWAHTLDDISQYRAAIADDTHNVRADYGSGDFDTRHLLTATMSYAIPGMAHGPKILTNGWSLNTLINFHTGQPWDEVLPNGKPLIPFTSANYSGMLRDPFAGLSHTFSAANGGTQWIDPTALCTASTPGCKLFGRNKFYGPGYGSVDFSVIKEFPIKERFHIQLRAEMFNLFNRINLASGPGAVDNGSGYVSDTIGDFNGAPGIGPGEAFNMQLGIKIKF